MPSLDLSDDPTRYSISTIGTYTSTHDQSLILHDEPPKRRGLFDRMLRRSGSPSNDSGHSRATSMASPTFFTPVPSKPESLPNLGKDSPPRRSFTGSRPSSPLSSHSTAALPPTTNNLSNAERAEKIRRNRKLLQILGDVPFDLGSRATGDLAQDAAAAIYHDVPMAATTPRHLRRHSSPISPVFAREAIVSPRVIRKSGGPGSSSPVRSSYSRSSRDSYFDFGDDAEGHLTPVTTRPPHRLSTSNLSIASFSTVSTTNSIGGGPGTGLDTVSKTKTQTPAELERARKRATLAKLHRFLGSRIPPALVLGISFPSVQEENIEPLWLREKKPARWSAASNDGLSIRLSTDSDEGPTAYMSDGELDIRSRAGTRLTDAEKARIVKKKKKIERMLGECPPAALNNLPVQDITEDWLILPATPGRSELYTRHDYSINSLAYLVKNNQQEQLTDLFTYIRDDNAPGTSSAVPEAPNMDSDRASTPVSDSASHTPSPPSPSASFLSFHTTDIELGNDGGMPDDFQNRRKRAAKLVGFFGVEYRELFSEVLEVIESEVQSDRDRGSLSAEEVQELLTKLRKLKL